jgi:triosephosphate isomerase (TIM)
MNMKRLVIGNWKMHLTPGEASLLVKRLEAHIDPASNTDVVICPPFIDLHSVAKELDHKKLKLGAQNAHHLDEGPYTGEISAAMLKGLASYVILGHSERRAMGETDAEIGKKVAAAVRNDLIPVLCVGENLHDHHHKLSLKVVTDQLTAGLHMLTDQDVAKVVIAYEPVWAIGAGAPASPTQIRPVIRAIRTTIEELYGEAASAGVRITYGGSVVGDYVGGILAIDGIEGLLVGGASLNYAEFSKIIKAVQEYDGE